MYSGTGKVEMAVRRTSQLFTANGTGGCLKAHEKIKKFAVAIFCAHHRSMGTWSHYV